MNNVYITKTSHFFPNDPVSSDEMELRLGMINGKPSKARSIILRKNGIQTRYYALDQQGNVTHTNVQMAANVVRKLADKGLKLADVDLLSCGTASPEQLVPSHGVMVHGALQEMRDVEVVSFAGSCCTGMDALKYAYMAVASGESKNAVVTASERISAWMRAQYFQTESEELDKLEERPILAFDKEFLRWMLSDGALALLVQPQPASEGDSLRVEWIKKTSFANELQTCMYAGGEKDENGDLQGWAMFEEQEWLSRSLFAVKQDTRMLGENIINFGAKFMKRCLTEHDLSANDIDWFCPHLSSMFFKDEIIKYQKENDMYIPIDRWFINLTQVGNIASASAFAMMDGLLHSGRLKKGQKILMMVPESARFSYTFALLTVC